MGSADDFHARVRFHTFRFRKVRRGLHLSCSQHADECLSR